MTCIELAAMNVIRQLLTGTHQHTEDNMSAHVDGELSGPRGWRFGRHLVWCSGCRAVYESLRATVAGLRALGAQDSMLEPQLTIADVVVDRIESSQADGGER